MQIDVTPVHGRGTALHPIWWRGRQWAVTNYGVEALDGTYAIEARRLTEGLGAIAPRVWLCEQVACEEWVDVDDLATAWLVAMTLHGVRTGAARTIRGAIARLPLPRARPTSASQKSQ